MANPNSNLQPGIIDWKKPYAQAEKGEWVCVMHGWDCYMICRKNAQPSRIHRFLQRWLLGWRWVKYDYLMTQWRMFNPDEKPAGIS